MYVGEMTLCVGEYGGGECTGESMEECVPSFLLISFVVVVYLFVFLPIPRVSGYGGGDPGLELDRMTFRW